MPCRARGDRLRDLVSAGLVEARPDLRPSRPAETILRSSGTAPKFASRYSS